MVLEEAKQLLVENNIPFDLTEFESEKEYWYHMSLFPNTKNAKPCKVFAIVIHGANGKKDIELQFNAVNGVFLFVDLFFGDFSFEMFDYEEEMLANELLEIINKIRDGRIIVIVASDLKKEYWLGNACFDISDNDNLFGAPGFEKAVQRIQKNKGFFSKLLNTKKQYEIYDWNTYQCIVK